jgi:hypothetical protein
MTFGWLLPRSRSVVPGPGDRTGEKSPDFLVENHEGVQLFVECILVQPTELVQGERARINQLKSTLESVELEDCVLHLAVHAVGPRTMPWQNFMGEVAAAVGYVSKVAERGVEREVSYCQDGWEFDVTARHLGRGLSGLGSWTPDLTRVLTDDLTLKSRIQKKRRKYRQLGLPLVVAVALESGFSDEIAVTDALFGPSVLTVPLDGSPAFISWSPNPGFWSREGRFNARGVPAVLVSHDFVAGACHDESIEQWVCPGEAQPFPGTAATLRLQEEGGWSVVRGRDDGPEVSNRKGLI